METIKCANVDETAFKHETRAIKNHLTIVQVLWCLLPIRGADENKVKRSKSVARIRMVLSCYERVIFSIHLFGRIFLEYINFSFADFLKSQQEPEKNHTFATS